MLKLLQSEDQVFKKHVMALPTFFVLLCRKEITSILVRTKMYFIYRKIFVTKCEIVL